MKTIITNSKFPFIISYTTIHGLLFELCREFYFLSASITTVPPTASVSQPSVILSTVTELYTQGCKTTGFPRPRVIWRKIAGPSYRTHSVGNLLKIRNARKKDSGIYTCLASNVAGKANASIFVLVKGEYITILCLHKLFHPLSRIVKNHMY